MGHNVYGIRRAGAGIDGGSGFTLTSGNGTSGTDLQLAFGLSTTDNYTWQTSDRLGSSAPVTGHYFGSRTKINGSYTAEGAWTLGPIFSVNYEAPIHKISGQLAVATPSSPTTNEAGHFLMSSNLKRGAYGNRFTDSLCGAGILLDSHSLVSGPAIAFYTNVKDTNDATRVGAITAEGYWSLGPSASPFAMKRFSGTTSGSGAISVAHGLSASRIVSVIGNVVNGGLNNERTTVLIKWNDTYLTSNTGYDSKDFVLYVFYEA